LKSRISISAIVVAVLVLAAFTLAFAKSTKLITSYRNPELVGVKFKKIMVVGMSPNAGRRADFEDALSASLARPGLEIVPGNQLLLRPPGSKLDLDYVRTQVRENHIDGVVLARLVRVEDSITVVPDSFYSAYPYYRTFYGYYGAVYPVVYQPGYVDHDVKVRIETSVFAAKPPDGELVWTATSDTFNPKDAHKVIKDVVKVVTEEINKEGIF